MNTKQKAKDFLGSNSFIEVYDHFENVKEVGEIIPGYYLGYDESKNGYYVVSGQGKPGEELFFIPNSQLLFDPLRFLSDKKINSLQKNDPILLADEKFCSNLDKIENLFKFDIFTSVKFYKACKLAGFRDQMSIVLWFLNKIEDLLKSKS